MLLTLYRLCTARVLQKFRGGAGWNCPAVFRVSRPQKHRRTNTAVAPLVDVPRKQHFEVPLLLSVRWVLQCQEPKLTAAV